MPTFKCEICDSYQTYSMEVPEFCPNCGSQKGPWKKIKEGLKLVAGSSLFIIYKEQEFGRSEIKTFFSDLKDGEGNSVYKYCENKRSMLIFFFDVEGKINVKATIDTKNYFLLNGERITETPKYIKSGDQLSLFSAAKSSNLVSFEVS